MDIHDSFPPSGPRPPLRERVTAKLDAVAGWWPRAILVHFVWPAILAILMGSGLWSLFQGGNLVAQHAGNDVPIRERLITLAIVAGAGLFIALVHWISRRRARRRGEALGSQHTLMTNARLSWVAILPVAGALAQKGIEVAHPFVTIFYACCAASGVAVAAYWWRRQQDLSSGGSAGIDAHLPASKAGATTAPAGNRLGWVVVVTLMVAYGIALSYLSITNHHALRTRTIDLGYYDNIFYHTVRGNILGCTFVKGGNHASAHFDPILIFFSPFHLLYPFAETLLILQSAWLALGAVPLYRLAQAVVKRTWIALVFVLAYLAYPALHGANLYEFHSLTLAGPILFWVLFTAHTQRWRGYWLSVAALLLCREDMPLVLSFVALYLIGEGERRRGWQTILISVVYLLVAKLVFMPSADILNSGKDSYGYAYYYKDLIPDNYGVGSLLLSLITNPLYVLKHAFAENKLLFLLKIFAPLAFLTLLRPRSWILIAYGLLFILLASRDPVFSTHFQYPIVLFPMMFFIALRVLADMQTPESRIAKVFAALGLVPRRMVSAAAMATLVMSVLISWKFGAIAPNDAFKGGFVSVARRLTDADRETYAWIKEARALIPHNAPVAASNKLGPHISGRAYAVLYPRKITDYVFVDERELKGNDKSNHTRRTQNGQLEELSRYKTFALFRHHPEVPKDKDAGPEEDEDTPILDDRDPDAAKLPVKDAKALRAPTDAAIAPRPQLAPPARLQPAGGDGADPQ